MNVSLLAPALGFFMAGGACRYCLQATESRLQIGMFWVIAILAEMAVAALSARTTSSADMLANGIASTAGIIVVRTMLEGLPFR